MIGFPCRFRTIGKVNVTRRTIPEGGEYALHSVHAARGDQIVDLTKNECSLFSDVQNAAIGRILL